jgi:hypothetical protein
MSYTYPHDYLDLPVLRAGDKVRWYTASQCGSSRCRCGKSGVVLRAWTDDKGWGQYPMLEVQWCDGRVTVIDRELAVGVL